MKSLYSFHLLLTGLLAVVPAARAQEHQHRAGDVQTLGQVVFSTSCTAEVREDFNRAVAMLHSFWYQTSEQAFAAVAQKDPSCAMAYWGIAMSRFHQLWEKPGPENVRVGQTALGKAKTVGAESERERGYINALAQFYQDANKVDHLNRLVAYERAMEESLPAVCRRLGGNNLLRARPVGHSLFLSARQDLCPPEEGGRHSGRDLCYAAESSRCDTLPHPQL